MDAWTPLVDQLIARLTPLLIREVPPWQLGTKLSVRTQSIGLANAAAIGLIPANSMRVVLMVSGNGSNAFGMNLTGLSGVSNGVAITAATPVLTMSVETHGTLPQLGWSVVQFTAGPLVFNWWEVVLLSQT